MTTRLFVRAGLTIGIVLLSLVAVGTLWFENRRLENVNEEIRTQLLDRVTTEIGGRTASYTKPKKVERAAVEAVGSSVVASITSVADVESVATASETVASTLEGEYQVSKKKTIITERHGRIITSIPVGAVDGDSGAVSFILHQRFEYSLVRFKNNGDAILLNVKERSPLTHEILRESMVTPDEFLVARHRKKLRDRFGCRPTVGLGTPEQVNST